MATFDSLPVEIIQQIALQLKLREMLALRCVSREMNLLLADPHFWMTMCQKSDLLFSGESDLLKADYLRMFIQRFPCCGRFRDHPLVLRAAFALSPAEYLLFGIDGSLMLMKEGGFSSRIMEERFVDVNTFGPNWVGVTSSGTVFLNMAGQLAQLPSFKTAVRATMFAQGAIIAVRSTNLYCIMGHGTRPVHVTSPFIQNITGLFGTVQGVLLVGEQGAIALWNLDAATKFFFRVSFLFVAARERQNVYVTVGFCVCRFESRYEKSYDCLMAASSHSPKQAVCAALIFSRLNVRASELLVLRIVSLMGP
jgi:hypothetical protein